MSTLIISFIIIVTAIMWFLIGSKGNYILKTFTIGFCLWYGAALYYGIPTMMGWPTTNIPPEGSFIVSYSIEEPSIGNKGAIYLWLRLPKDNKENKPNIIWQFDPKKAFNYLYGVSPRAYEIPYDKNIQKELTDKKNKSKLKFIGKKEKGEKGKGKKGRKGKKEQKIYIIIKNVFEIFKKD